MDPLGTMIPWIAATGILGLLGVTLLERLVPILPSTALLVALGIAVAEGHWSLHMALWSSTAGSVLGSLSLYGLGLALGEVRSFALLKGTARLLGVSKAQLGRLIVSFRRHERGTGLCLAVDSERALDCPGHCGTPARSAPELSRGYDFRSHAVEFALDRRRLCRCTHG